MTEDQLQTIRRHREGPVLRLTLDRPEVLNAINGTMLLEIREALAEAFQQAHPRAHKKD